MKDKKERKREAKISSLRNIAECELYTLAVLKKKKKSCNLCETSEDI